MTIPISISSSPCANDEKLFIHPQLDASVSALLRQAVVSPNELCKILNRSRSTIHKALHSGEIASFMVAGSVNVPVAPLFSLLRLDSAAVLVN